MPALTRRAFLRGTAAVVVGAAVVAAGFSAAMTAPAMADDTYADAWSFDTLSITAGSTVSLGHWKITLPVT